MSGEINFNALIYTCTSMCLSHFFQTMWFEFRTQINTHFNLVVKYFGYFSLPLNLLRHPKQPLP